MVKFSFTAYCLLPPAWIIIALHPELEGQCSMGRVASRCCPSVVMFILILDSSFQKKISLIINFRNVFLEYSVISYDDSYLGYLVGNNV